MKDNKGQRVVFTGALIAAFSVGAAHAADLVKTQDLSKSTLIAMEDGKDSGCSGKDGGCSGDMGKKMKKADDTTPTGAAPSTGATNQNMDSNPAPTKDKSTP